MNNLNNSDFKDLVNIDVEKIVEYLTCKICKGIFKEPHTISECNHSFCKSCIIIYLYNNKESICPICKKYLGSKPNEIVIPDLSLERFVEIVFPEFKDLDEKEEKLIYKYCRDKKFPLPDDVELKKNENIIVTLLPFKNVRPDLILSKFQTSEIKVEFNMTIEVLKKYIKNKIDISLQSWENIEIIYKNQILKNDYKIKNVLDIYGGSEEDFQNIFYYYRKE